MPYPNYHSCRMNDPSKYEKIRTDKNAMKVNGKSVDVLYGIKNGKSEIQAYRYPTSSFSEGEAKKHCSDKSGSFHPAKKTSSEHEPLVFSHNSTTSDSEPSWSDVDKTKLPRKAFADQGNAEDKNSWKYPHHWVKDGKLGKDEGGNEVYTSGKMYLHEGGLNAAWAAANGSRSGQEASNEVKSHLQKHRNTNKKSSSAMH